MRLNVNSNAVVAFSNKLEKIGKSALPVAVRQTLNSVAFDAKKNTLLQTAGQSFTERRKNFFKATSRVSMAKGFEINSMHSTLGFIGGEKNQAIRNLEDQETGGNIGGRSFIPMNNARVGKNNKKNVRKKYLLKNINNIKNAVSSQDLQVKSKQLGKGGFVLYDNILFEVARISKGRTKLNPIYSYERGRSVRVKPTGFVKKAALQSRQKTETLFIKEARKRINRIK